MIDEKTTVAPENIEEQISKEEKYIIAKDVRKGHVDAILTSTARKKIVVAGPGTGKTYLFQKILNGKKNTLTLTFVNALVEDLSLELRGLSDVKTLHSFARSELSKATKKDVNLFPKLHLIIAEDAKILLEQDIDFNYIFHNRDDKNIYIEFYNKRREYYDKYYGYSDIIFAIVKYFEAVNEKIPIYEQVVVDEFQDFNKLEVSLIELLAEKSPVLLAGDDDQALYDFKSASAEYIRHRHSEENEEYVSFGLPYCSRCTRVIVDATNDIISAARKNGCLGERVNKQYLYFDEEDKDKESEQNPHIVYSQLFAKQIPWFIEQRIGEIADEVRKKFSVLIISPTTVQSGSIAKALREKGFANVEFTERKSGQETTLLDGLKTLLVNDKSNLGWRITLKHLLKKKEFDALLKQTSENAAGVLSDLVEKDIKKEITNMLKVLRGVKKESDVDEAALDEIFAKIELAPHVMAKEFLREELADVQRIGRPGLRKIPITATTIQSSKGLAADYVFIAYFDDQYFIKDKDKRKISDQDVCKFLVALTRARKKIFLISSNKNREPIFLEWIDESRIKRI